MGAMGPFHWLILLAIVFLLFGNRLPSVMRSLGRGVTEFKKGLEGVGDDEDEALERPRKKKPAAEIEEDDESERPKKKPTAEADGNGSAKSEKAAEKPAGEK